MENKNTKGNHDGHRMRMKQKFINNGLSSFEEHEILELLLFYSIPRKNTNEIAHELIKKFGNIANVFDTNIELLKEVDGVTENSAILLKMIPQMFNIYSNCNDEKSALNLSSIDDMKEIAIKQYIGETTEILKAIYLDSNCGYIACSDICTLNNSMAIILNIKKIIERAEKFGSAHIILLHNHPNGNLKPSKDDIISTEKVMKIFKDLGLTLVEHIIVSKNEALAMRNSGYINSI